MALILRYVDVRGEGIESVCWSAISSPDGGNRMWEERKKKGKKKGLLGFGQVE